MIYLIKDRCDYCGTCVGVCPENCIELLEMELVIDHAACTECHKCIWICPVEALYREKKR
jgi:ferredoxin